VGTTLPPQWSGNALLSAVELPLTSSVAGGVNPVTWTASFQSDASGLSVNWAWSAAVYTTFATSYGTLGVKPVDDTHVSQYQNSDHAGTPENFKSKVVGGARGGGGSNYTGSLSGTLSVTPSTNLCANVTCTASDQCHVVGTCNQSTGVCSNPNATDGSLCGGPNKCDIYTCQNGACSGSNAVTCTAADQCHVAGSCDPSTGACTNPAAPDGTACNDSNPCTQTDTCQAGTCVGSNPVTCSASDQCHTAGTCDPVSGQCTSSAAPDGTSCTGSNLCNQLYACASGACVGSNPVVCAAPDQCSTPGSCDPTTGQCSAVQSIQGCATTTDHWTSVAGRPSPREGAVAAVTTPNSLVLFGGENAGGSLEDTWTLDRNSGRWSVCYANGPGPHSAAAATYDTNRKRLVLFGGILRAASGDTYLADTWEYDPSQSKWASVATSVAPPARGYAAIAFDSVRNKTVVFGGRGPTGAADGGTFWEWDGSQWTMRASTGGPGARSSSAMVFDSARARFVLFGGETPGSAASGISFNDTWELDAQSATWTSIATSGTPPARLGHSMYYDTTRARVVLFGGTSAAQIGLADTWEYDPASGAWSARITPITPPARAGHTLVFDSVTGHGILSGGVAYSQTGIHTPELDDTWDFDPVAVSWTQRTVDTAPFLYRPGIAYDTNRQTLVLRGDERRPAMWELSGGRWSATDMLAGQNTDYGNAFSQGAPNGCSHQYGFSPCGAQRYELAVASLVYDSGRGKTMFFAGREPTSAGEPLQAVPAEIWEWDGRTWQKRQCTGAPLGLNNAGIAFDAKRELVVVAGGETTASGDYGQRAFQTWEVDPASCTWTARTPTTQPPSRVLPLMTWDSARGIVVLFGGAVPPFGVPLNDTWEWDGAAGTWTDRSQTNAPSPREGGAMTFDSGRSRAVLFGGVDASNTALNDLWEYDGVAGTWSMVTVPGGPSARRDASLAYDPNRQTVVLFGGGLSYPYDPPTFSDELAYVTPLSDLWEYDGGHWTRRILGASPAAQSGASVGWFAAGNEALLFGGVRGDGERAFLNDTWMWKSGEWARLSDARGDTAPTPPRRNDGLQWLPEGRAGHAFAAQSTLLGGDGITALLFGGEGAEGLLDDTWLWDNNNYIWTPLPTVLGPSARTGHAIAAFANQGFLLFGGTGAGGELLGDSWAFNTSFWTPASQFDSPPARTAHAMVADLARSKIVMFGGRGDGGALRDTWEWDPQGCCGGAWTERHPALSPPARFGHAMFYDSNRATVVLVGGTGDDPTSNYGDTWEWDGQAGTWSKIFTVADLAPRSGAVAFFDALQGTPVVYGGLGYRVNGTVATTYGDTQSLIRANELSRNGIACSQNSACASGSCVDGYCCNSACAGECGACDVAGALGTCTAVSGAPHGARGTCGSSPVCSACNGTDIAACHSAPAGTACGPASCNGSLATTAATCDGNGTCQSGIFIACAPYGCGPGFCYTTCGPAAPCPVVDFCNQSSTPVCSAYSRLGSVTHSPDTPAVNTPLTVTAALSAGDSPVFVSLYFGPNDIFGSAPCQATNTGSGWVGTCVFTPTTAGNYDFVVRVASAGSPNQPVDDANGFAFTVTP
jgi:N-acetylneuraminic acid mutarotase